MSNIDYNQLYPVNLELEQVLFGLIEAFELPPAVRYAKLMNGYDISTLVPPDIGSQKQIRVDVVDTEMWRTVFHLVCNPPLYRFHVKEPEFIFLQDQFVIPIMQLILDLHGLRYS